MRLCPLPNSFVLCVTRIALFADTVALIIVSLGTITVPSLSRNALIISYCLDAILLNATLSNTSKNFHITHEFCFVRFSRHLQILQLQLLKAFLFCPFVKFFRVFSSIYSDICGIIVLHYIPSLSGFINSISLFISVLSKPASFPSLSLGSFSYI